jgi:hypothetical protein
MRRSALGLAVVSALAVTGVASAQEGGGGSWTYGAPLGAGRSAIYGDFGWPGIDIGYMSGLNDRMDLAGFFAFNYGLEGDPSPFNSGTWPGIRLGGTLKYLVARNGRADISVDFSAAFISYFKDGDTLLGVSLPVPQLVIGLPITPVLLINFGIRIPWAVGVLTGNGQSNFAMLVPIQPGAGMEFALDSRLSFTFNFRVGPIIEDVNGTTTTDAAFDALVGVTYRL